MSKLDKMLFVAYTALAIALFFVLIGGVSLSVDALQAWVQVSVLKPSPAPSQSYNSPTTVHL